MLMYRRTDHVTMRISRLNGSTASVPPTRIVSSSTCTYAKLTIHVLLFKWGLIYSLFLFTLSQNTRRIDCAKVQTT